MSTAPSGSSDRADSGSGGSGGSGGQPELADRLAALTLAVPGVADLHGGVFGEVATYLPGRKVAGVRVEDDHVEIHVSVLYDEPVRATAEAVASRLEPVAGRPVHVTVDDVVLPSEVVREEADRSASDARSVSDARPAPSAGPTSSSADTPTTSSSASSSASSSSKETSS